MPTGVRVAGLMRAPAPTISAASSLFLFLYLSSSSLVLVLSAPSDTETLLEFKRSLTSARALRDWNPKVPPCDNNRPNWAGVLCLNGHVRGLRLENMGLKGEVNVDPLVSLSRMRTLSFMNNTLVGPWPSVISKLHNLRSVYLSYNHFSGAIPDDAFTGMKFLKKVFLTNNEFNGQIPSSLASLSRLMELRLDGNKFRGQVPRLEMPTLKKLNVSNNELEGPIPRSLSHMDPSSFAGNRDLCGDPFPECERALISSAGLLKIAVIVIILGVTLAVIAAIFIIMNLRRQPALQLGKGNAGVTEEDQNKYMSSKPTTAVVGDGYRSTESSVAQAKRGAEHGKLLFVRDDREKFDLQDLLRASAEILGSGSFGSSYKATILCNAVVVKRYKHMNNVGREEFHEHMRRLGRLTHPNLLPLVAYYYRKEEKLLISDFVDEGSLASHLHGNHNLEEPGIDWATRLKIIRGIARGMSYLYTSLPSIAAPHGHLKSSNVLLDESLEPLLTDYGLIPVANVEHGQTLMMAYKSPEYAHLGRISKKTDVWSFGILILEMLTGRFPENYLTRNHDTKSDLATWVNNMIKEKKTSLVFDAELGRARESNKGELLKMLKIALSCCEEDVERRLDLNQVVAQIEDLNDADLSDNDGDNFASTSRNSQMPV
ncbi:pollen receptor-like kinase 4 [Cucurbita maxima]|uniref:non-specific serine/threonine protein kinase n=1 Tax=Cucurbita maxima TaxID=3661 RepID=A0A6J1IP04_CUCMA|nr:pollen receptor-like kinase 4 [Cucurbita maxima]